MARKRKDVSLSGGAGFAIMLIGAGMAQAVPDMIIPPEYGWAVAAFGVLLLFWNVGFYLWDRFFGDDDDGPPSGPTINQTHSGSGNNIGTIKSADFGEADEQGR